VDKDQMFNLLTPRTVVQLSVWVLMFGLGAGLAGLILFAIYQGQVNNLREELLDSQEELQKSIDERLQQAPSSPAPEASLNVSSATPDPTHQILESAAPAIVGITGRDSGRQAVSGTGFVVNSTDNSGTWVVTNNSLVTGVEDFNDLTVRHRNSNLVAEVYETDPGRDLALVIYRVPADRSLRFSRLKELKEGDPVWALGHTRGEPYATAVAAKVASVSGSSIGLDTAIEDSFAGGPLLDEDGRVVGVLTSRGTVTGPGETGGSAVPIELVCQRILRCPSTSRTSATPTPTPQTTPSPGSPPAAPAPPPAPAPAPPAPAPPAPGAPVDPNVVQQPPPSDPNAPDVPIG
jgi:S1-C subfamily serine protease